MDKTIVWRGPLFDPSGYGSAGRGYVFALLNNDIPVKVVIRNFSVGSDITEDNVTTISLQDFHALTAIQVKQKIEDVDNIIFVDHNTPNILNGVVGAYKM